MSAILLVFLRLSAFFFTSPFPGPQVPAMVRIVLAAGLSYGLTLGAGSPSPQLDSLAGAVIGEVLLGLMCGFLLTLVLHAFTTGGEMAGQQMGLGTPGFINPLGAHMTLMGSAFTFIAVAVFVLGEGPGRVVVFLLRSVELVPPGTFGGLAYAPAKLVITAGQELFVLGIRAAAPMITGVFASQLVLAVLARSVPTLNLFVEGPALTVSTGVIGLIASLHTFSPLVEQAFLHRLESLAVWVLPALVLP